MRTTVMIEDDVYATAKQIAENSGRTLGEVISQLARKGLASEPSFDIKNGVPVFRIDFYSTFVQPSAYAGCSHSLRSCRTFRAPRCSRTTRLRHMLPIS